MSSHRLGEPAAPRVTQGAAFRKVCQSGNLELVNQMLDAGVDVDGMQEDGCTALWLAAEQGRASVVDALLRNGGDPTKAKVNGNVTPLYVAAQNGHTDVVSVLLKHNVTPNVAKSTGAGPLFIAAQQGFTEICHMLLKAGADPEAANNLGIQPLMIAAYQGHPVICEMLLDFGANPHAVGAGKNTIQWAAANNHEVSVGEVLAQHRDRHSRRSKGRSSPTRGRRDDDEHDERWVEGTPGSMGVLKMSPSPKRQATTNADASWYTPSFLVKSSPQRKGVQGQLSYANPNDSRYSPQRSFSARSGKGGHRLQHNTSAIGGGITESFAAEERRRKMAFAEGRKQEVLAVASPARNNRITSGSPGMMTLGRTSPKRSNTALQIDVEWEKHKKKIAALEDYLDETKYDVEDEWLYSWTALKEYTEHTRPMRELEMRDREFHRDRAMAPTAAKDVKEVGMVLPTVPTEVRRSLHHFMMDGQGARGPPTPDEKSYQKRGRSMTSTPQPQHGDPMDLTISTPSDPYGEGIPRTHSNLSGAPAGSEATTPVSAAPRSVEIGGALASPYGSMSMAGLTAAKRLAMRKASRMNMKST